MNEDEYTAFGPMKLGALIRRLETVQWLEEPDSSGGRGRFLSFDFGGLVPDFLSSYRGFYDHLAISFKSGAHARVPDLVVKLKAAVGQEFSGWKGGEYTMTEETPVWVANPGECGNTGVHDVALDGYSFVIIGTRYCPT